SPASEQLAVLTSEELGPVLTDSRGRVLYTSERDTSDVSTCIAACATTWIPFAPAAGKPTLPPSVGGTVAFVRRTGGAPQALYNDKHVYSSSGDASAGSVQ